MKKIVEPIFTPDEVDEEKTGLELGYRTGRELLFGPDFTKPFANAFERGRQQFVEKINGTAKKRNAHAKINKFGWARYMPGGYAGPSQILFGVKWAVYGKHSVRLMQSAVAKYKQLLGYLLQSAGWKNIETDEDDHYVVTLDNEQDIKNLYELSPSIGFYYKGEMPTVEDLQIQASNVRIEKAKARQKNVQRGGRGK